MRLEIEAWMTTSEVSISAPLKHYVNTHSMSLEWCLILNMEFFYFLGVCGNLTIMTGKIRCSIIGAF